jgi:hypothetical protein
METLNFIINNNKNEIETILKEKYYKKIGHVKENCVGICVFINSKNYFELDSIENVHIYKTSNISDLKLYC